MPTHPLHEAIILRCREYKLPVGTHNSDIKYLTQLLTDGVVSFLPPQIRLSRGIGRSVWSDEHHHGEIRINPLILETPDPLEEAICIAHELGHHLGYRCGYITMEEYSRHIEIHEQAFADRKDDPTAAFTHSLDDRRMVYSNEADAWARGRHELDAIGWTDWPLFRRVRREKLLTYWKGLGLAEAA